MDYTIRKATKEDLLGILNLVKELAIYEKEPEAVTATLKDYENNFEDVRLVKWQVLDWNEPAINFYKKNNAIIETNWWNVKIFTD